MEMVSASVVDLATDDWRREFHAIGQREDPDSKIIIMPEVERRTPTSEDEHLQRVSTL